MRYVFSCFWEGQEGSFLLWSFWQALIGFLIIRKKDRFEKETMSIIALVQAFLATMILGVVIAGTKIGSNPFMLLREHPDFGNIPLFSNPDYLEKLDGRGLNPLLQNYWMTIHPPTLFLGFALTLVPFAYALAGLWKQDYSGWQKIALPWTLGGVMILGAGILMGGAWAYEALSFGGFWAWDPVENASLVPWLTLVGALHVMIVNKNRGDSLFSAHLLAIATFILVLYSTFLTRSGILGNASVHAFTDLGMQKQLLLYLLIFAGISILLLQKKQIAFYSYLTISSILFLFIFLFNFYPSYNLIAWSAISMGYIFIGYFKHFPKDQHEEELFSREFWLFIGALVILLSAVTITLFTSIPIFNKLFDLKKAPFTVEKYNTWEIPFAIIIALIMGFAQFLKYKKSDKKTVFKQMRYAAIPTLLFGSVGAFALYFGTAYSNANENARQNYPMYAILLYTSCFAFFGNFDYLVRVAKGKIKGSGASVAHIGFALILIGALISTSKKITLSKNSSGKSVSSLGKEYNDQKSLLMMQNDTLQMGEYLVTYTGKKKEGIHIYFEVEYYKPNKNGKLEKSFTLYPKVQLNQRMGNSAEPDTRHFLNRDIYTHVTYADLELDEEKQGENPYTDPVNNIIHPGDTLFTSNAIIRLDSLKTNLTEQQFAKGDSDLIVTAVLKARDINGTVFTARPKYKLVKDHIEPINDSIPELGVKFSFWKINPDEGSVEIMHSEKKSNQKDFIVMEAYMFPFINILWLGCVLMVIGTLIAMSERIRKNKLAEQK